MSQRCHPHRGRICRDRAGLAAWRPWGGRLCLDLRRCKVGAHWLCLREVCTGSACVVVVAGLHPPMGDSGTRSDCVATMNMLNDMFQRQAHTQPPCRHATALALLSVANCAVLARRLEGSNRSCISARKMRARSKPSRNRRRRRWRRLVAWRGTTRSRLLASRRAHTQWKSCSSR